MSRCTLHRSVALVAIVGFLGACESTTGSSPTPSSRHVGASVSSSPSATPAALTLIYQAINSSDRSIHEAVISDGRVDDHIVANDPTISFLFGFTPPSTIAVRKDAPGAGTTVVGTIDVNTGAYHQVYSMDHTSTHEMLGPELGPGGTDALFEDQNGISSDWVVLNMTTGQTRSLNLTNGGGVVAWTSSYILFNTGAALIEVDPLTGAQSPVANSSGYSFASPDGSHLAGVVHRDLGDPQRCMNTIVTAGLGGQGSTVAAGKNMFYRLLGVASTGEVLFYQDACGPGVQNAEPDGKASVELWRSGQVVQQFTASATDQWANAKFAGESSALMQRDSLTQENTPDGPAGIVTASELDLIGLCSTTACQASTLLISQAHGRSPGYVYFAGTP
jgi:hypothetical protein